MRVPEMPLEPSPFENRWGHDFDLPEDDDRIHALVKIADERTGARILRSAQNDRKPQFVGPSAELMPDEGRCGHRPLREGGDGDG